MEPNYKEIAEDLRYHYNKFIDLWKKAKEHGLSLYLEDTFDYRTFHLSKNHDLKLHIYHTETF